jgi:hypothetical protein
MRERIYRRVENFPGEMFEIGLSRRIRKKLRTYRMADWLAYRTYAETDYISIDWIRDQLRTKRCQICQCELKLIERNTLMQFSVDRLDDNVAHIKANCQIACLKCNKAKAYPCLPIERGEVLLRNKII